MRRKLRALDLYCGAGGVAEGLRRAGFEVTGVDVEPQRHFPFEFVQRSALRLTPKYLRGFDLVWASPPCQAHSALRHMQGAGYASKHKNLIPATRRLLRAAGVPYIIENVEGAPLLDPLMLCGSMFGMRFRGHYLRRHRLFETSMPLRVRLECDHRGKAVGVYGHGQQLRRGTREAYGLAADDARRLMGIDWMPRDRLSQAIPPVYSEYLGRQARRIILGKG